MIRFRPIFLSVLVMTALMSAGCTKQSDYPVPETFERGDVVKYTLNGSLTLEETRKACKGFNVDDLKYPVDCYKLEYITLYKEEKVHTEALVLIPRGVDRMRMMMYCHGTNVPMSVGNSGKYFSDYSGPDCRKNYDEIYGITMPMAASGYFVILPEYTGFGFTADRQHPFIYGPELCKSTIDGLFAFRSMLEMMGYTPDNDLYLAGWSQGALASVATEKYLERDYPGQFNIIANSCLSGPYNMEHFFRSALANDDLHLAIALYSWAGYVINYFSPLMQRPLDQIFCFPVYDQSQAILVASATPKEVFRDYFIKNVLNGNDEAFNKAIKETSYSSGWMPESHVFLHHGTKDIIVPFFNSEDAYEGFKAGGKCKLIPFEGKGHFDAVIDYTKEMMKEYREVSGE